MLKKIIGTMAVAALAIVPTQQASAQLAKGYTDVGVVVGLGNIGDAGASFGGRFERVFKDLPDMGGGTLGIGVSADYYSYSWSRYYDYTYIPIGATANYHFKLDDKKWDVFVGAGLGFQIINCTYNGPGGNIDLCDNGSLYFIGRAGGRYFMKPNLALYADVGAGAATANIGVTFKLK